MLPLRSIVRFTGLNTSNQRYGGEISSVKCEFDTPPKMKLKVNDNSSIKVGETAVISGVTGLDPTVSEVIVEKNGVDELVIENKRLTYVVNSYETFRVVSGSTTYYFLRIYTNTGNTVAPGTTVNFQSVPSPLSSLGSQTLTVYNADSYVITFMTTTSPPWGLSTTYFPAISASLVPPNVTNYSSALVTKGNSSICLVRDSVYIPASLVGASVTKGGLPSEGYVSDHGRSELDVTHDLVEDFNRTLSGTMRGHHQATKRKFNLSWDLLPADKEGTVDGYWGGNDLLDIYRANVGSFNIEVYTRESARKTSDGPDQRARVRIESFSYSIVKRNFHIEATNKITDLWKVDLTLEEI